MPNANRQEVVRRMKQQLLRMDQNVKAMGVGEMTHQDLHQAAQNINRGLMQAGVITQPIDLSELAEGGFINDQSGKATEQLRGQLGLHPVPDTQAGGR